MLDIPDGTISLTEYNKTSISLHSHLRCDYALKLLKTKISVDIDTNLK
jgi:hypothetical protein